MRFCRLLAPAGTSSAEGLVTVTEHSLDLSDPVREHPCGCAADFRTATCATPDRTVVRAYGEIDMATGAAFRTALIAGLDRQPPLLVVDVDGVSFLDACGLGVLVEVANRAARAGIPITVIGARPRVYRVFALTRLVDRLDVHPTPTAATPDPRPGPTSRGSRVGRPHTRRHPGQVVQQGDASDIVARQTPRCTTWPGPE
jgi:anti-anti-sigma factor